MKKALCLIVLATLTNLSIAQSGSWYIGGVVGYGSKTEKDANDFKNTTSNWAFGPEIGTFLKDDIQLGIALGLGGSTTKNDSIDLSSSSNVNPTLYVRKFFKITDNFSTFAGLYLNYLSESQTNEVSDIKSEGSGFGARIGIGVAYALSPRFTIVGQYGLLGFQSVSYKVAGADEGSESSFDFGVNSVGGSTFSQGNGSGSVFNVGIYYTFKSK